MSEEGESGAHGTGGTGDDLNEQNKAKRKIIRVLTVIAYTLSVSMAAILLSIYYIFMWDGHPTLARKGPPGHIQTSSQLVPEEFLPAIDNAFEEHLVDVPYEPTAIPVVEAKTEGLTPSTTLYPSLETASNKNAVDDIDDVDLWQTLEHSNMTSKPLEMIKRSPMFKKLLRNKMME